MDATLAVSADTATVATTAAAASSTTTTTAAASASTGVGLKRSRRGMSSTAGVEFDTDEDADASPIVYTSDSLFMTLPAMKKSRRSSRRRVGIREEDIADAPPSEQPSEQMGPFWFEAGRNFPVNERGRLTIERRGISQEEKQLLAELLRTGRVTEDLLRNHVVPLNDETSTAPRLRAHDWLLTNLLKGIPILSMTRGADGAVGTVTDLFATYVQQLSSDHRQCFDSFRRGTHLFFTVDGVRHHTTAGQLNYVLFMIDNGIDEIVMEREAEVRASMRRAAYSKAAMKGKRRSAITSAPLMVRAGCDVTLTLDLGCQDGIASRNR